MNPKRRDDCRFSALDSTGGAVLAVDGGETVVLNPVAAVVWSMCDGTQSSDDIADLMNGAAGAEADRIDVRAVLAAFAANGLLETAA